jgi:hypothetical protein
MAWTTTKMKTMPVYYYKKGDKVGKCPFFRSSRAFTTTKTKTKFFKKNFSDSKCPYYYENEDKEILRIKDMNNTTY